jgi:hypothetical protein
MLHTTTALQFLKTKKYYTLAGFEPGIFCSVGGPDDHYATTPGHLGRSLASAQLVPGANPTITSYNASLVKKLLA